MVCSGSDQDLVLHGGGNTSVKAPFKDIFGKDIPALYVKGSGWDLATIEKEGFAPVSFPRPAFAALHASLPTCALRLGACVSVLSGDSWWKVGVVGRQGVGGRVMVEGRNRRRTVG